MADKLTIMEWNIHQQGLYCKDTPLPIWIIDEFAGSDIVVLTEYCHRNNRSEEFVQAIREKGYHCVFSKNTGGNDILIAVKDCYPVVEHTFEACYGIDHIPENLRVDIMVGEGIISVVGVRIKTVGYTERKTELEWLMKQIKDIANPIVITGDFNNNQRKTIEKRWNLDVLDKCLLPGFARITPDGSSIFEEKSRSEFPEDHFLAKGMTLEALPYDREFCTRHKTIYQWGKDFQLYKGKDDVEHIRVGYPNHAILKGSIEF